VKHLLPGALAAVNWLIFVVLLNTACIPQPQGQARGPAPVSEPPDPLGWSSRVDQNPELTLDSLVAHCRQVSQLNGRFETFAQPCTIEAKGLTLKFDRYLLDTNKRVVAISGMHPDLGTFEKLRGLMNNQSGSVHYADICMRLGNNSLPELTITSKDQCEQLNLGLI
jgi:hypothetical protein